jgi:hypothetical protein
VGDLCFFEGRSGERRASRVPRLALEALRDLVCGRFALLYLLEECPGERLRRRLSTGETEACRFLCRCELRRGEGECRCRFERCGDLSSCRVDRRLSRLLLLPRERRLVEGGGISSLLRLPGLLSPSWSRPCFLSDRECGDDLLSLDGDRGRRARPRSVSSRPYRLELAVSRCREALDDISVEITMEPILSAL